MGVGLRWLLQFMNAQYHGAPDHLHVKSPGRAPRVIVQWPEAELDELWSFVGKKANRQWVWIAMDATTRQVIAFHIGDRSQVSAEHLWANLPAIYREQAIFYTDQYAVYKGVIPPARHHAISKLARNTNHVERFNCTLRQRVSWLVRGTLSFSKKLANHIGAIKYFICDYNLTKSAASPG
jgi:insertion element IS1 protein InsB